MSQELVSYVVDDGIAVITIERPEVRNALNEAVVSGLQAAWQRLADGNERAAVLAAAGDVAGEELQATTVSLVFASAVVFSGLMPRTLFR